MNFRFPLALLGGRRGCAMLFVTALLLAGRSSAATSLDIEPHWKAGEHLDYVLTKHGVVTSGLQVQVDTTNTTPIRIDVLKADADGYVIGWTQGSTRFDVAAAANMNPVMKKMADIMVGHRLDLRVDGTGRLREVMNWAEIRDLGDALARDVASLLANSGVDGGRRMQVTGQIRGMFSSEQTVRMSSTREAQLLLLLLGHTYDRTQPVLVDVVEPDPTGPGSVTVRQRVTVKQVLGPDVSLQWTQVGAEERVSGGALIELATGWPSSISQSVTAAANGDRRMETTSLQRK